MVQSLTCHVLLCCGNTMVLDKGISVLISHTRFSFDYYCYPDNLLFSSDFNTLKIFESFFIFSGCEHLYKTIISINGASPHTCYRFSLCYWLWGTQHLLSQILGPDSCHLQMLHGLTLNKSRTFWKWYSNMDVIYNNSSWNHRF